MISGTLAAMSGAAYALLFAYAGSTLASIQYSIHPLLWTLARRRRDGARSGARHGLMFLLVDLASSASPTPICWWWASVLIALVLFFPKGILGTLRQRWLPWLP